MNTDHLIEELHSANAQRWRGEHKAAPPRLKWRLLALPVAAAALLLVLLPREKKEQAAIGIYCNSQCTPDEVLALMDNNINHIKQMQNS